MRLDIEHAHITFRNGGCTRQRAEQISRLTFEYVHRAAARGAPSGGRRVERINVPPLRLALDTMSNRQIARVAARAVLRAVSGSES
jgi:hypothetical protein